MNELKTMRQVLYYIYVFDTGELWGTLHLTRYSPPPPPQKKKKKPEVAINPKTGLQSPTINLPKTAELNKR